MFIFFAVTFPSLWITITSLLGFPVFSLILSLNFVDMIRIIFPPNYFDHSIPVLKHIKWRPLSVEEPYSTLV